MIRVVTIDEYDDQLLGKFCRILYTAFGVGSEHSGSIKPPVGFSPPYDAAKLVDAADGVNAYRDDKLLYLTAMKLKDRQLPSGLAPTHGFAKYGKDRALVSTAGIKSFDNEMKTVARHALHQLGHTWDLHHCLDPRCSMYPPWTRSFAAGEALFCTFCRDKSDQKIRLAKS